MRCKKTTLKNGLRILTIPMKENPTATVLVAVGLGSKYETKDKNGISHFLEHMCFKGTSKRPTALHITHELDSLGSESNAFTSQEMTAYYAKSDAKNTGKLIEIISDIYLNSTFPDSEIQKEKGVIIEEINMYEDLPQRKVYSVLLELLYGDVPAGFTIAGPIQNIKNMNREDFLFYKNNYYTASNTVICVSGGIDEKETIKSLKKAFEDVPLGKKKTKPKVKEVQNKPQVKIFTKKIDQTHLILAFRSVPYGHKLMSAISVMSAVLGIGMSSRLFQKLREDMGVAYSISAGSDYYTDHGFLSISSGVTTTRTKDAISVILSECKKMKEDLVPEKELAKAKRFLIGRMKLGLEGSDDIAEFYIDQEMLLNGFKTPEDRARAIKNIKAEDVRKAARIIFKKEVLNLAIVGPHDSEEAFKDILEI